MNKSVIVANSVESKGAALDETGRPNLSSVLDILAYLAKTSDAMKDTGEPSRKAVRLFKAFWVSMTAVIVLGVSFVVSGLRGSGVASAYTMLFVLVVGGVGLAWIGETAPRVLSTKHKWRRPVVVRAFERDKKYVEDLAACKESLLNHAKGTLQRHVNRVKNRMDGIIKPVGLLSTVTLVGPIWTGWNALLPYLANLHVGSGGLELIRDYGFYWIILMFVGLQLARLSIWWSTVDYTYRIELIESAIERKRVIEDQ